MEQAQLDYVREQLKRGVDQKVLRETLAENGYDKKLIDELFESVAQSETKQKGSGSLLSSFTLPKFTLRLPSVPKLLSGLRVLAIIGFIGGLTFFSIVVYQSFSTPVSGDDTKRQLEMLQLPFEAREYLVSNNRSYAGYCDTPIVAKVRHDSAGNFECVDGKNGFAIMTTLESGEPYCVDSNKFAGITERGEFSSNFCYGNLLQVEMQDVIKTLNEFGVVNATTEEHFIKMRTAAESYALDSDAGYTDFCSSVEFRALERHIENGVTCYATSTAYYFDTLLESESGDRIFGSGSNGTFSIMDTGIIDEFFN